MFGPNLNSLRMFDASARHLNFRLAAEELNVTHGAVSQRVRRLEADLDMSLFRRKARGLELTDVGRSYHLPVSRALAIIDEATQKLRPHRTIVKLSITMALASNWLVPRLDAFSQANPDVEIEIIASDELADFQSDGVDLGIRQGHPPFGPDLKFELLSPLDLCVVCNPTFAAGVGKIKECWEFAAHKLIQDGHRHWEKMLEGAGAQSPHGILQVNQTALAIDAAIHGQGIALVPRILLGSELLKGSLVELWSDERGDQNGYYVVHPTLQRPNPARQLVIDWILSQADHPLTEKSEFEPDHE